MSSRSPPSTSRDHLKRDVCVRLVVSRDLSWVSLTQHLCSVLHFVLFVYACVDTHRLRKSRAISDVNGANEDDRGDGGIVVGSERLSVVKDSEQFEMTLR